jgi:hypothetical protein
MRYCPDATAIGRVGSADAPQFCPRGHSAVWRLALVVMVVMMMVLPTPEKAVVVVVMAPPVAMVMVVMMVAGELDAPLGPLRHHARVVGPQRGHRIGDRLEQISKGIGSK